jgi:hypothetical protein
MDYPSVYTDHVPPAGDPHASGSKNRSSISNYAATVRVVSVSQIPGRWARALPRWIGSCGSAGLDSYSRSPLGDSAPSVFWVGNDSRNDADRKIIGAPFANTGKRLAPLNLGLGFVSGLVNIAFGVFSTFQIGFVAGHHPSTLDTALERIPIVVSYIDVGFSDQAEMM